MDQLTLLFIAVLILAVFIILCFVLCMVCLSKVNKLNDYADDGNFSATIQEYYNKVEQLSKDISSTSDGAIVSELRELKNQAALSMKKTAIVNFDAYEDVSGKFSFSMAVLNDLNDGFILTSLYGHNACNTYIREIKNGASQTFLLEEEKQALEKAVNLKLV